MCVPLSHEHNISVIHTYPLWAAGSKTAITAMYVAAG